VSSGAGWRQRPLSHLECMLRILQSRGIVNPILEAPWIKTSCFRMDWLHVADLGVTGDFLGNFFHVVEPLFNGANKKERCASIYKEMAAYYDANGVEDRFDCLMPTFFDQDKSTSPYKLRGGAAKIRALVPFAWQIAQEMLDMDVPMHSAIAQAAFHLHETYAALSANHPAPVDAMKEHGRKFAIQYVALHDFLHPANDRAFRIKPKMHLFLHITSDDSLPRLTWTYRDEDFGGSVARMARRRGNVLRASSTSKLTLARFKIETPCIRIR
jgi:hypothetical protein